MTPLRAPIANDVSFTISYKSIADNGRAEYNVFIIKGPVLIQHTNELIQSNRFDANA